MATIADRTVQTVTTRVLKLTGECYTRKHTLGTDWNVIRIGIRHLWSGDPGAGAPIVNPRFGFGICENAGVGDGVRFDAPSGQRSVGYATPTTGVTRAVNGGLSYWASPANTPTATRNDGAGSDVGTSSVQICGCFVETVDAWFPYILEFDLTAASASVAAIKRITPPASPMPAIYKGITLAQFQTAIQAATMSDVSTAINTYHTTNGGTTPLCAYSAGVVPAAFASQADRDLCKVGVFVSSKSPTMTLELDEFVCYKVS